VINRQVSDWFRVSQDFFKSGFFDEGAG
jgi:hypothetical protein